MKRTDQRTWHGRVEEDMERIAQTSDTCSMYTAKGHDDMWGETKVESETITCTLYVIVSIIHVCGTQQSWRTGLVLVPRIAGSVAGMRSNTLCLCLKIRKVCMAKWRYEVEKAFLRAVVPLSDIRYTWAALHS